MKFLLTAVLALVSTSASATGYIEDFEDCDRPIYSDKLKVAANKGFDRINRPSSTYSYGFEIVSKTFPNYCPTVSSKDRVAVASRVTARVWDEEGDAAEESSECYLDIERIDGDWVPTYLVCDDFGIEDDLD